jgi:6-phosphofructokinase 1
MAFGVRISLMRKKSLLYFQSGGPTPVINCSLYGVIEEALSSPSIGGVYGSLNGVEGLINGEVVDLTKEDPGQISLLRQTPGAILGSSRLHLEESDSKIFAAIRKTLERLNVGYVLVNGGNDSMDTCQKLYSYFEKEHLSIKCLGIPKTIDNDLALNDHSLGYPSVARYLINTVKQAAIDNQTYKRGKVLIIEAMGRDAGWLTASADLLEKPYRPDLIYLPEGGWDTERFLRDVEVVYKKKNSAVVVASEGIDVPHLNFGMTDSFGHKSLEGVSNALSRLVSERLGIGNRSMLLATAQRSDAIMASAVDVSEAEMCGRYAVKSALAGETGKVVCLKRVSDSPYKSECALEDVDKVANVSRLFPKEWIVGPTRMSDAFRTYLRPLVSGVRDLVFEDGILVTAELKKVRA